MTLDPTNGLCGWKGNLSAIDPSQQYYFSMVVASNQTVTMHYQLSEKTVGTTPRGFICEIDRESA